MSMQCDNSELSASCSLINSAKGLWDCSCYSYDYDKGNSMSLRVNLTNVGDVDLCGFTANLCGSGKQVEFDGPSECGKESESVSTGNCSQEYVCKQTEEFDGGLTAVAFTEDRYVYCNENTTDEWSCSCQSNVTGTYGDFDLSTALAPRKTCDTGQTVCGTGLTFDPSVEAECAITSTYAARNGSSCSAGLECGQTTQYPDAEATLYAPLNAYCTHGTGDAWDCSCSNNYESVEFDYTSAETAIQTCEDAVNYCHDQNLISLGGTSNGGVSPLPL
jgi:hypothetical protein